MQITYTGKTDTLTPLQREKLQERYGKLGQLADTRGGDKNVHVILTQERHLHHAEITLNLRDHGLVGKGSDTDLFAALVAAIDNALKQAVRLRQKRRDQRRESKTKFEGAPVAVRIAEEELYGSRQPDSLPAEDDTAVPISVDLNTEHQGRKPMSVDEALLEMELEGREYLAFCEAATNKFSVLVHRPDGNFDLLQDV